MNVTKIEGAAPIKAWTDGVPVEDQAAAQLANTARMPFIYKWLAVMPDVHWGMGSTVGSVVPTQKAIIPAAVGVDIGCGMVAQKTGLHANDLPDSLGPLRSAIEASIPHGRTDNGGRNDKGAWGETPPDIEAGWVKLTAEYDALCEINPEIAGRRSPMGQLGTLGTGNHFIEVCLDEDEGVWVMLHSGSRGAGNRIGSRYIALAKKDMQKWMINVPDVDLAYLPEGSEHFHAYMKAVHWAQDYARINRQLMLSRTLLALSGSIKAPLSFHPTTDQAINCHHNYVAKESHYGQNVWVTRKGAVSAKAGELGIIPGSMGARSYIVRGKGNPESFMSCSHGAGRAMSRRQAREQFTLEDHERDTYGIECRKDEGVLDETPGAYKDIDAVMAAQTDLVEVVHTLSQVVCVKG